MVHSQKHSGLFAFEQQLPPEPEDENTIVIPENLEELEDADFDESNPESLISRAITAFDELFESGPETVDAVTALNELATAIDTLRNEFTRRETVREEARAEAQAAHERVHGTAPAAEGEVEGEPPVAETPPPAPVAEPELESVAASSRPNTEPARPKAQRINVPLSEIRKRAPQPESEPTLSIKAAADVPRWQAGHVFGSVEELANAFYERAKTTPVSSSGDVNGPKVATIQNHFKHVVGRDTSPAEMEAMIKEITSPSALVAGGGWCAPSEINYNFFDITCEDGMVDLPEFGVQRGGIRWPTSPSLADVFTGTFTNATNPWLWTETDDILTVTGSTNKPCVRVPCPSFNEARLECYGICLTAGNLTDNAYPEATERQLGLLRSAHYHAMNQRYLATLSTLSTAVTVTGMANDAESIAADLPAMVGWAAVDYRQRYGMCRNDVLEVILPTWILEVIRIDLAKRTGVEAWSVTDAEIGEFFDVRNVRVQFVNDWQIRSGVQPGGSTPSSILPPTVDFLIYAAGTFARGNGMTLDLGVVRDSTLNAENDHTAAWTEECHLIAMFGHASRRYTVSICAAGRTGIANLATCGTGA